ncbi:hypothetical protein NSB25_17480 [Acetatifactor muris]|uniref:hypothetical protein n=1 Tax=Acetatifactor muris TaxID=879566 RepID=UPI00214B9772|nr:hypothetical protein [Acetatifactor muris]MCR2049064.1 hypothetical protein [Acetatifactor muris]
MGGVEDASAFSEQLSPSGAEPTGADSDKEAQETIATDEGKSAGTNPEGEETEKDTPEGGVPDAPDPEGEETEKDTPEGGVPDAPDSEGEETEKDGPEGGAPDAPDSEGEETEKDGPEGGAPDAPDSEGEETEKDGPEGGAPDAPDLQGEASDTTDGDDGTQEGLNPDGEVLTGPALRAAASAERTSSGVTFEKTGDYAYNIYANGQPLLIEVSSSPQYAELYIDENRNGIGDQGEEITELRGDKTDGIFYLDGKGYFLPNTTIYGGGRDGECQYDTSVMLKGSQDMFNLSVKAIYGGNANGTLTGSACVDIKGGSVWQVFGGNAEGTLVGDTCVSISDGTAIDVYGGGNRAETNGNTFIYITGGNAENIYGGSDTGQVNGNTLVDVKNAQVGPVFGGNKASGKVTGDTKLVFGENAQATGWVYGGGEGTDDNAIVEVAGSTNIIVNDGTFTQIFGGGRKGTVGNSNITVNAGNISQYIYGGGGEASSVTGKASITVNGGSLYGVCASGASGVGTTVKDAEILLKNVEMQYFNCNSPVEGKLSVSFENASASNFSLTENAIDTAGATLSFINCGSAEKGWTEQPEVKFMPDQNKFHTILMQNSYIRFKDNSTVGDDCTLGGCAEKLIFDGGALWVDGNNMLFGMPPTEFRNNPLLMRTIDYDPIHFDVVPEGTARIQWIDGSGTAIEGKNESTLVETPAEAPDSLFTAGIPEYALKRGSASRYSYPDNILLWEGATWYVMGPVEEFCQCWLYEPTLKQQDFQWSGEGNQTVTLEEIHAGDANYSVSCEVVGHKGTTVTVEYSVISEGTTAPGASVAGDQLTVGGTGSVHVGMIKRLNGKILEGDRYVQILKVPDSDSYIFAKDKPEDIRFSFNGITASGILNQVLLWNFSVDSPLVQKNYYFIESDENTVSFHLAGSYLEGLELGEYEFRAQIPYVNGGGKSSSYLYNFTVQVVQVIAVDNPVIEISDGPFYYDGTPKKPSVVVKDGNTVIPEEEYEVAYEDNIGDGTASATACVIITDKPGGRYAVNGSREFEIVNEYTAENGTDYLAKLNEKGWTNEDFVISAAEGHLLSTGNTLTDEWTQTLPPRTEETDGGSVTFYVKDDETGLISLAAKESYKLDRTAPEGADILFDGNSVKTEPGNITFSGLFGKNVKVEVTAEDTLSGIGDISYLWSEKILTQEELENANGWTGGREFEISAEDGRKFVVYGKATDQAGNTVFIASEGGEFDLKAPEISGIEPDGTYYVTQIASVTDAHLDRVTVNGQAVSGSEKVTLSGNREATYVIKALDRLGHETVVTVTMKPISSLAEPIKGLTEDNVASDDAETIRQVLEAAKSVMTENAAAVEKDELQALIETCESLYRKALADYRILEGDGSEWTLGADGEITFRANGAFSKFAGILIDGQSVDPEGYTASEGSTVITLKKDLLKMLAVGTHSLTVLYSDGGQASAGFEIMEDSGTGEEEPSEPGGDDSGSGTETPGSGDDGPGSGTQTPGSGGDDSGSGTQTPGPGGDDSGSGTQTPGSGDDGPGSGTQTPGPGDGSPGSGTETPDSGSGASGSKAENMISPKTGDDRLSVPQFILWMLPAAGAVAACYGIARNRRRK